MRLLIGVSPGSGAPEQTSDLCRWCEWPCQVAAVMAVLLATNLAAVDQLPLMLVLLFIGY
jgi:hypothetical protein